MRLGYPEAVLLFGMLAALGPAVASAQSRPSLERLTDAMCKKSDVDQDSYRPYVCDARCDCLSGRDLSILVSCAEQPPGDYAARSPALNLGTCGVAPVCVSIGGGPDVCSGSSFAPCPGCAAPEVCLILGAVCAETCFVDADCVQPEQICSLSSLAIGCSSDADCAIGESCLDDPRTTLGGKRCARPCSNDLDCSPVFELEVSLAGVDANDEGAVAQCDALSAIEPDSPTPLNSKDAAACLASIEAVTGPCQ